MDYYYKGQFPELDGLSTRFVREPPVVEEGEEAEEPAYTFNDAIENLKYLGQVDQSPQVINDWLRQHNQ